MQTKHYRTKAVAICEAMAELNEQMAEMHSGKKWFNYSINALRWRQMTYIVRHNATARMRFFLKHRDLFTLHKIDR